MTASQLPTIVGIDESPAGLGAVRWAAHEAKRHGTPLEIVHLTDKPQPLDVRDDTPGVVLHAAAEARKWEPGLTVTTAAWHDSPAAALVERSHHAALIVVGSRGHHGLSDLLAESVGTQLSTYAHCPVLVVHQAERWAAPEAVLPHSGTIVVGVGVGVDGSASTTHALEHAFTEAALWQVPLTAVHAWQEPHRWHGHGPSITRLETIEENRLAADVELWSAKFPEVTVELRTVHGNTAEVLLDAAHDAVMIVLGAQGLDDFNLLRLGSVTQQVLHHTTGRVLIIRG